MVLSADQGQIDSLQSYGNKTGRLEDWKSGSKCLNFLVFLVVC
jgi:hypothetical protein